MSEPLPKACVLVGAGASFDAWNGHLGRNTEWQPPLTSELFGPRFTFEGVLGHYPGAQALAQNLVARAQGGGTFSLEEELLSLASHPSDQVRQQFKHIPPYLRDIIATAAERYLRVGSGESSTGVFWPLVQGLLANRPHEVAFVVMNYDEYVERTLSLFDSGTYYFRHITDYVDTARPAFVIKPHGSVSWFAILGDSSASWPDRVRDTELDTLEPELIISPRFEPAGPIVGVPDIRTSNNNRVVYPILTAPLAGKGEKDLVCPSAHIDRLAEFLPTCRKFLFLGTSGLDQDIMSILSTGITDVGAVHYVGGDDVDDVRQRFQDAIAPLNSHSSSTFSGFRDYVLGGDFARFVAA